MESPVPPLALGTEDAAYTSADHAFNQLIVLSLHSHHFFLLLQVIQSKYKGTARYLWISTKIDHGVQLNLGLELSEEPRMPVLVDGPLGLIQISRLKEVGGKHISGILKTLDVSIQNHFTFVFFIVF